MQYDQEEQEIVDDWIPTLCQEEREFLDEWITTLTDSRVRVVRDQLQMDRTIEKCRVLVRSHGSEPLIHRRLAMTVVPLYHLVRFAGSRFPWDPAVVERWSLWLDTLFDLVRSYLERGAAIYWAREKEANSAVAEMSHRIDKANEACRRLLFSIEETGECHSSWGFELASALGSVLLLCSHQIMIPKAVALMMLDIERDLTLAWVDLPEGPNKDELLVIYVRLSRTFAGLLYDLA